MLDISSFLMRWLFLSNLLRDTAEIQTLPHQPYQPPPPPPPETIISRQISEAMYRDDCVRGILANPPGAQRTLVIDALRSELVQQLWQQLRKADQILDRLEASRFHNEQNKQQTSQASNFNRRKRSLDEDTEIVKAFERRTRARRKSVAPEVPPPVPPAEWEVEEARRTLRESREFLPQLVAAAVRAPPGTSDLCDPLGRIRKLLLRRCLHDPSWGIELCWLLEAEVGQAWKKLFERQAGRRLIIVLPAQKAKVIASIGSAKKEAFDLLQDAEQATAYGYTSFGEDDQNQENQFVEETESSRLPSSIGLQRCSHFGDSMHFIDRLTKISSDLRGVQPSDRLSTLQESLSEMNRRIRRRMVTKGGTTLDVDDGRDSQGWPLLTDIAIEDIPHSIHLSLVPQSGTWPTGKDTWEPNCRASMDRNEGGVPRVLNIVVAESRLLSSRERCPFLTHVELVDSGIEGNDARLYGSGSLGSTVEEAIGIHEIPQMGQVLEGRSNHNQYDIPPELLQEPVYLPEQPKWRARKPAFVTNQPAPAFVRPDSSLEMNFEATQTLSRGGSQSDEYLQESVDPEYYSPYEDFRSQEYEQVHYQLQTKVPRQLVAQRPSYSAGRELLDKVFGAPWNEKCKEIRNSSPYGHLENWRLASFILKAGEDIRKEALVMQIISKLRYWFDTEIPERYRPYMRPYTIMCVGGDAGLLECLSDAKSVDEVKKKTDGFTSLRNFFERAYPRAANMHPGTNDGISFEMAQENFLRSLVGYSVVCYILQIKDRHNANILLDREGHIIHIDFGFVLGETPKMGKVPIFSERAPFKLSADFWEVLGGWNLRQGGMGVKFCKMFELAFACASNHADEIAALVESAMQVLEPNPRTARLLANGVRNRLRMTGPPNSKEQQMFVVDIVNTALKSWGTSTYDWLQKNMNGYQ